MTSSTTSRPPASDRRNQISRDALVQRVYGEFHEMPCMRLTPAQARRLFGLRSDVCERVLEDLVRSGSLVCDAEQFRFNDSRDWPVHAGHQPHILFAHAS
jgi:hypothetical protein